MSNPKKLEAVKEFVEELRYRLATEKKFAAMLLALEKKRRKVNNNELIFVGMHNIASYYWCGMQALLKSRREEMVFFKTYLFDRIRWACELGYIDQLPKDEEDILKIGDSIRYSEIAKQSGKERKSANSKLIKVSHKYRRLTDESVAPFQFLSKGSKEPMERGVVADQFVARNYPTIQWNFPWRKYAIIGRPDGVTSRLVYEFKTTGFSQDAALSFVKPIASTQADLYGYFFQRKFKLVEIFFEKESAVESWQELVKKSNAEIVLKKFLETDRGRLPKPPKRFKCSACDADIKARCPIRPRK